MYLDRDQVTSAQGRHRMLRRPTKRVESWHIHTKQLRLTLSNIVPVTYKHHNNGCVCVSTEASALHQHKRVAQQCRNTSVTSWLLAMSEAYQEEDAVVQSGLHLCCCSGAGSHDSLVHNSRQPRHLVVGEVIPSNKLVQRRLSRG